MTYVGPIYELEGLRLQDLRAHCPACGKRLAEVVHDPDGNWRCAAVVCIDCGTEVRSAIIPSTVAPGLRVADCLLCNWTSMPSDTANAARLARMHYLRSHGQVA